VCRVRVVALRVVRLLLGKVQHLRRVGLLPRLLARRQDAEVSVEARCSLLGPLVCSGPRMSSGTQ